MSVAVRLHTHARKRSADPTKTTGLRKAFEADAARRFKKIATAIIQEVGKKNAFGLRRILSPVVNLGRFEFTTDARKIEAFMEWLRELEAAGIINITPGVPIAESAAEAWSSTYIQSAYRSGVASASRNLRGAGVEVSDRWIDAAFQRPIHADRIGQIFTRTFSALEGVTQEMDKQISRVLAEGLSLGDGPIEIARKMADRVQKIGITRARLIARTEVIASHATATLNTYKEAQVSGVRVESEFATAGDSRVCQECKGLEGKIYTLAEAEGVIPVHPNCRCAWIPALIAPDGLRLNLREMGE